MRNILVLAVLIMLVSSCIGQEEKSSQWTAEEWRDHLFFANLDTNQSMYNMAAGLVNVQELTPGTHVVFEGGGRGYSPGFYGASLTSYGMDMGITVLDKEVVNGIECTVLEVTMEMRTNIEGEPISIAVAGKEWANAAGNPVRVIAEVKMTTYEGFETSIKTDVEQVGEEHYNGYDCWVFSGTQTTGMMGISVESEVMQYMDKKSYAVVDTFIDDEKQEMIKEYTDVITYVSELEWELGGRKAITTELGEYDCQVIYLKSEGKKVGTIWAHEEFRTPLKYEISYEMKDIELKMNMTLIEYIWGS